LNALSGFAGEGVLHYGKLMDLNSIRDAIKRAR
jgi:hypothetical protein